MAGSGLPSEVLEGQLDTWELLHAMYPAADDESSNTETEAVVQDLRLWLEDSTSACPHLPDTLGLLISLHDPDDGAGSLQIDVTLPFGQLAEHSASEEEIPLYRLRVLQPQWLTKAEVVHLSQDIPGDDIVSALEYITERAREADLSRALQASTIATNHDTMPLVRVWFYFPSISTREKRDDIVNYAPSYGLTGFLLAGKPGILCLEGNAQEIDSYMNFIKTQSWGDIPPQHKKVSERLRETGEDVTRVFPAMEEITDSIEKRGARGNRGNMQAVEAWLDERGLKDAFTKVLM
ncbi:hypothetical protein CKM354_000339100 [Cercospora kikuchii]|uniref:Small nuclear ribonucleoprotein Prp3 C-terminal domain-containing protein n=1 Tax=Cercospora kikuchii TaxID=84275 RepID=A0A9P3FA89_9PEZI|nr:uncharacterized protein CKM354_000339100 [Cercospora kikuchii]GIZ40036.1 hypothetical protein CKM354_000339100 [Cercospora kikuchii]